MVSTDYIFSKGCFSDCFYKVKRRKKCMLCFYFTIIQTDQCEYEALPSHSHRSSSLSSPGQRADP